ncbi:MAG: hypothetical protein QME60_08245 [Verrucomicrobiota bacterium]|nr:hypothetical protein [Verrucomicrobiota bacterium]
MKSQRSTPGIRRSIGACLGAFRQNLGPQQQKQAQPFELARDKNNAAQREQGTGDAGCSVV